MNPIHGQATGGQMSASRGSNRSSAPEILLAFGPQEPVGRTLKLGRESLLDEFHSKQVKIKNEVTDRDSQITTLLAEIERAERTLEAESQRLEEAEKLEYEMRLRASMARDKMDIENRKKRETSQNQKKLQREKFQLSKNLETATLEANTLKLQLIKEKESYTNRENEAKKLCQQLEALHNEVEQDRKQYEEKMKLIRRFNEESDVLTRKIAAMKYVIRATVTTWTPELEATYEASAPDDSRNTTSPSPMSSLQKPPPDATFATSDW